MAAIDILADAAEKANQDPYSLPLDKINVANPFLFARDIHGPWFKRLRDEAPVHYCAESFFGPYWSITRYEEIVKVDTSHEIFSSEPAITIGDTQEYLSPADVYRHGPTQARRATQGRKPGHGRREPASFRTDYSRSAPSTCSTSCRSARPLTGSTASPSN